MIHLIVNPVAGRGRALKALSRIETHLANRGLPYRPHITRAPGHATEIVCGLPPDARVLSLGGDGTLHEVACACIGTSRTLGVLPGGSGDDFAFALELDRHSLDDALEAAVSPCVRLVDTGVVNGVPFINSLGIGFDAEVAYNVQHAPRLLRERSAYLYAVLETLRTLETPSVEIVVDDQPFYRGPALLASVQNGPRTGGSFLFAPHANVDDGQLELIVAGSISRPGLLSLLPRVMKGRHLGRPQVFATHGRQIVMHWEKPRRGHAEGELLPASCRFEIGLKPASLRVAVKHRG